jgi:predicted phage terminase large subunit-like protein
METSEKRERLREALKYELARREFWEFCLYYDYEFYSSRPFLKDIADSFQDIAENKIKSLSISMPPRAGKSYITTLFCAWLLGRFPKESVMRNACTATLYVKFSYDVRAVFKSDKFRAIFSSRLSDDKSNLNGWNTNEAKMVSYFGAGVGGTIIGFGASKVAITDDLYRGLEDALSDTINDRIIQWKEATHDSRLESGCARIDIGTRWSVNDVIGRNIEAGIYDKSLIISALDNNDLTFCEAVKSTDEYLEMRKRLPKEIWLAEYQQNPVDLEGRLFGGLKLLTESEFDEITNAKKTRDNPLGIDGCIGYIDVADQGNDYTALLIGALIGNQIYLVDYLFSRENTDITIPMAAAKLNKWNASYCRVESNAMGAMYSRNLQKMVKTRILQVHNQQNKMTRIIMQSAFILNTFNFVERKDANYYQFIENLAAFSKEGKNKNDDAPDCAAGLSMFIQSMFKNLR